MALKQVPILEHAESELQSIIKSRQGGNKIGKYKPVSRQAVVADALILLAKKERK